MFRNLVLCLLLLAPSVSLGQVKAVIDAPAKVNVGDLVVLDSNQSVGDNRLWVTDDRVKGRYLEIEDGRRVVFAIGAAGVYRFQLIVADTEASIDQVTHSVTVGTPPPTDPGDPGDPNDPIDPPPVPSKVREVSRLAALDLNDPVTTKALRAKLLSVIPTLVGKDQETQIFSIRVAVADVLGEREGDSRYKKNWIDKWRTPISIAISESLTGSNYLELIKEAAEGLPLSDSQSKVSQLPISISMYTGPNCIWCDRWNAEIRPTVTTVKKIPITSYEDFVNPVPYFEVRVGTKIGRHQGFMTLQQLDDLIAGLINS